MRGSGVGAPVRLLRQQRRETPGVRRGAQHVLVRAQCGHTVQAGLPAKVDLGDGVTKAHGGTVVVIPRTPNDAPCPAVNPGLRAEARGTAHLMSPAL